ncbi:MAG: GAF domain-containing protein [Desulfobacterales bacterium]|nr:GAF domain-containing protein [Desulfobacterales bacterium]
MPEEHIFEIVEHLNKGLPTINNRSEILELAKLNHLAGRRASEANASAAAYDFYRMSLRLLGESSWDDNYALSLEVYQEAAVIAYLNADNDMIEKYIGIVIDKSKTLMDKIRVYETKLQVYSTQNRFVEGVDLGLTCLRLLGVELPPHPDHAEVRVWIDRTAHTLADYSSDELLALPLMSDPLKLAAMRILTRMIPLSYFGRPILFPLISCQGIALSIEYGNAPDTPVAYVNYGLILCDPGVADYSAGYRHGLFAKQLQARQLRKQPIVINNFYAYIAPWKEYIPNIAEPLKKGYQVALEAGDLEFASYAITNYLIMITCFGWELEKLRQEFERYVESKERVRAAGILNYTLAFYQMVLNLQGIPENPIELKGRVYDETKMVTELSGHYAGRAMYGFCKIMLAYLFEAYEQAGQYVEQTEQYIYLLVGCHPLMQYCLYAALTEIMLGKTGPDLDKKVKLLKLWAEHAPMNYRHKYDLVEAEKARISGQFEQAAKGYEKAITGAKENGYLVEEGLAYELAAKFYFSQGMEKIAQIYLLEAYYRYQLWGAKAKLYQLEKRYPDLRVYGHKPVQGKVTETITSSQKDNMTGGQMDLSSVMKASQTISSEIQLAKLFERLLKILFESAGAERGVILINERDQWVIEAEGQANPETITVLHSQPLIESIGVSQQIISYVIRTQKPVLLDNATRDGLFINDPYIIRTKPRSVLCYPIIQHGRMGGIVYLENNLITASFLPERIALLRMLSGQIAISIENAKLYAQLEEKVKERTAELQQALHDLEQQHVQLKLTQTQLIQSEKMAGLGVMVAGIAHEINNPTNFVSLSSRTLEHDMTEFQAEVLEMLSGSDADTLRYFEEHFARFHQAITHVEEGSARIKTIVQDLRFFSRLDEAEKQEIQIADALDSTVRMVKTQYPKDQIEFVTEYANVQPLACYPAQLNQAFLNIIVNACQAIRQRQTEMNDSIPGRIVIRLHMIDRGLLVSIADNGCGMTPDVQRKIFEPFFTTKPVGQGTGLGMSISYGIIEKHQGRIEVASHIGQGTIATVFLPYTQNQ